jgi:calpain-7
MPMHSEEGAFNKEAFFNTLIQRLHRGDVLATVATGLLGEAEADRAGLVPTHAYAVLDVQEVKVGKIYIFLSKTDLSFIRESGCSN